MSVTTDALTCSREIAGADHASALAAILVGQSIGFLTEPAGEGSWRFRFAAGDEATVDRACREAEDLGGPADAHGLVRLLVEARITDEGALREFYGDWLAADAVEEEDARAAAAGEELEEMVFALLTSGEEPLDHGLEVSWRAQ